MARGSSSTQAHEAAWAGSPAARLATSERSRPMNSVRPAGFTANPSPAS